MKKYRVTLTPEERQQLTEGLKSGKYKSTKLKRTQILLGADESEGGKKMTDTELVRAFDVEVRMIERLRQRFVEEGFDIALHGKKGQVVRDCRFDSRVETQLITLRCSEPPEGSNKWSLRLLADKMVELEYVESMSHESVRRLLKKHQLSLGKSNRG